MTADVELLPMPSEPRSALAHWDHTDMKDYARANVAHATAAKDAEIGALRAEVETWKNFARGNKELLQESVYRAERLAEALREATTMLLVDYPATAKRLRAVIAAALEAAREDSERLVFLASERIPEGFVGDKDDIYDYACDCAEESGRDEPNDADLIEGYRRMIDSARAIDQARGEGIVPEQGEG